LAWRTTATHWLHIASFDQRRNDGTISIPPLGICGAIERLFPVAELVHNIRLTGFNGWVMQQLVLLRYLFGILPVWRALQRFDTFEMENGKALND